MTPNKPRMGTCKVCKCKFPKSRAIQPVCDNYDCKVEYCVTMSQKAERKRIAEKKRIAAEARKADKAKKESLKTRSDYIKEAQIAFNSYIRERDREKQCICCGEHLGAEEIGGAFDAGHYRSVGSAPHLRFNPDNCHAQRKRCNRYGGGRAVDYRIGLIARIGLEAVEALEADNEPRKWTIDELKAIRDEFKAKLKALRCNNETP